MTKKGKAIAKIDKAISGINEQLNRAQLAETDPVYRNQLVNLKSILVVMREEITFPKKNDESSNYRLGRIITDSWSFTDPLAAIILDAEHSFIEALKET